MQPADMTPQQHTDDSATNSSNVADLYYESRNNDVFIEVVHSHIREPLSHHWAKRPPADLRKTAF